MSKIFDIRSTKVKYRCLRCGYVATAEEISSKGDFMCPQCMFHILEKVRGEVVREVEAI
ncbi:DNA-directed RNA polymerase subunit P [Candidatus Geothermarchaeota archaeon ex4572_27]|nr:MAG: DNA-directed RNA polymerase subunit P [Candidatus Geothermarchaeota archaeon ex4572_27]